MSPATNPGWVGRARNAKLRRRKAKGTDELRKLKVFSDGGEGIALSRNEEWIKRTKKKTN